MTGGPIIDHYDWTGGREAMLRFGPDDGPVVIAALPLFEEANRTRAFMIAVLRALVERGIAGVLPDLPGTGESLIHTETVSLALLRAAHQALVNQVWDGRRRTYALGIRSGALLDATSFVHGRWHLAPQDGRSMLRELTRTRQAAFGASVRLGDAWFVDAIDASGNDVPVEIAGNLIAPRLLAELLKPSPPVTGPVRTVRLASDPRPADVHLAGAPLWRRSEPGNDPALARTVAADIARWIATCAA